MWLSASEKQMLQSEVEDLLLEWGEVYHAEHQEEVQA